MKNRRSPPIFGLLSIVLPIGTLAFLLKYQSEASAAFAVSAKSENHHIAWMILEEKMLLGILLIATACGFGLIFAVVSMYLRKRVTGIGLVGLILNAAPLVWIIIQ